MPLPLHLDAMIPSRRAFCSLSNWSKAPKVEIPTKEPEEALKLGTKLVGQTGTQYQIDRILQHTTEPVLSCVYLATYITLCFRILWLILLTSFVHSAEHEKKYVIKNIFHTEFEY